MDFKLEMRPDRPPIEWEDFAKNFPTFSIALDGAVAGGPNFLLRPDGPLATFNHHEGCDRLATRATCRQVLMAIRMGLFQSFRNSTNEVKITALCDDCDEDVCLSVFLLKHGHLFEHPFNPALNRLVAIEDELDATAGSYPYPPDLPIMRQIFWIFEPYRLFRHSGGLSRLNPREFESVVTDVESRITRHIMGEGEAISPDIRYGTIGVNRGWSIIKEVGVDARLGAIGDGIKAYVLVRARPNGRFTYIIGRVSAFIAHFNNDNIYEALNQAEGLATNPDRWGGGNTIGGSPRIAGSGLDPEELAGIVNSVVKF